ncbi:uncharacterized protein LOC105773606 [Gossypium raimondii]|uniref:Uncharacterized protein n=2 Tax=Gossypium raimondii TaxID=29730 RepID=A0A0D2UAA7_GOSRA|nr:uncharacterized protein LOC105773606 [Gossypium raimondii]KJB64876.1 hypothetical protein B456_010G069300 [Gossypium raimondii]
MARRTTQVLDSIYLMNTVEIFRESIRVILLHPTHFHSISVFLFSPLPVSLFLSHFLLHHFPQIPSSAITITDNLFIHGLPNFPSKTLVHIIVCTPSSITFSLLGRAATIQAVSDSYNGIHLDGRRLFMRSGLAWIKLLHTRSWELLVILGLFGAMVVGLAVAPKMLYTFGISSVGMGFWGVVGLLGIPFCVMFAHVMVVGNMANVIAVLESECDGLGSLWKAKKLMEGRRQTGLMMALLSNIGLRVVECVFELRICRGICMWEIPVLISMYSSVLVLETVMNVVLYYACKS